MDNLQEVEFNIPTTNFSSVVMTKIKAVVTTASLEPKETEEGTITLEEQLIDYVTKSSNFDTKLEEIKNSAKNFLPEGLGVANFVSISTAQALIASEFIQSTPVSGEILYVAVWDSVTCVEAPIIRKIVVNSTEEQPAQLPEEPVIVEPGVND